MSKGSPTKALQIGAITLATLLILTACGAKNPDLRPDDQKLRDGISLLVKDLKINHPGTRPWSDASIDLQLQKSLPTGYSTPAGWKLTWPNATSNELPFVYIPWTLTGTFPNHFAVENATYKGGTPVPSAVTHDIAKQVLGSDDFFSAIVDARYSSVNKKWVIFTSVPYLPVTDNGYGWATVVNGRWKVIDFGTATVGCGKVPTDVQSEFGFTCSNS
jgi:hypothetical protein